VPRTLAPLLKSSALAVLEQPVIGNLLVKVRPNRCLVLMLHRFRTPDGAHDGHDPQALRALLTFLRKSDIRLVDIDAAVSAIDDDPGQSLPVSVAFTVDDGYADLVEIGGPIFAEFDCPVTGFVTPDVIDGKCMFWWDQIDYVLRHAQRMSVSLELEGRPVVLTWSDRTSRGQVRDDLAERLKRVANRERLDCLEQLSRACDVPIPTAHPSYRVLSWSELQAAERRGLRFGAHTMSHPILSRCSDEQATNEIVESARRVGSALDNPSTLFCFPNGTPADFGEREMAAVRAAGLQGALTTSPGLLQSPMTDSHGVDWRWKLPRCAMDERPGRVARMLFL
jgi:peptidoglycan/xylan/chitin deacetylase (PgdA/CDA1 family)